MSTPNHAEINRANAQHSTGPKSAEGKQRSSLNALRHGLTGQMVVMPTEDPAAYERHLHALADEYRPQGATETLLVQALADASWRLNRAASMEASLLLSGENQSKTLCNLSLHTQRLSRQFERTVTQLRALQKTRQIDDDLALSALLDVIKMHKDKGITYDPAQDGFVFTESQILGAQQARNRERLISAARKRRFTARSTTCVQSPDHREPVAGDIQ